MGPWHQHNRYRQCLLQRRIRETCGPVHEKGRPPVPLVTSPHPFHRPLASTRSHVTRSSSRQSAMCSSPMTSASVRTSYCTSSNNDSTWTKAGSRVRPFSMRSMRRSHGWKPPTSISSKSRDTPAGSGRGLGWQGAVHWCEFDAVLAVCASERGGGEAWVDQVREHASRVLVVLSRGGRFPTRWMGRVFDVDVGARVVGILQVQWDPCHSLVASCIGGSRAASWYGITLTKRFLGYRVG